MNWMGYGPQIRQARREAYREQDRLINARLLTIPPTLSICITTGSKAEGLTRYLENDRDQLYVDNNVMCLENGTHCDTMSRETTVSTLNTDMCYHGHCRLDCF
ncbi:hypothetical protein DPMN_076820 [Dreissena polymorpha]|uniref:Uncharacterized protein n=1 Tax=Dreissena polymorpha TaxID=45954 RepID=A0A9D4BNR1_DREPO|nr:hypothetical protein DPMN_076819 [Dreissena polymorpha]KAH3701824.1 hypothetical protein DPMN_076820 [Dreissena polymorpha]